MEPGASIPWGFHNFFVLIIAVLLSLWTLKVGYRFFTVVRILCRLATSRPLALDRMSIYAREFQLLIRLHFNQILRIRRTVTPTQAACHHLLAHINPESIQVESSGKLGFTLDASSNCAVRLFWGVPLPDCNKLLQQAEGGSKGGERGSLWTSQRMAGQRARLVPDMGYGLSSGGATSSTALLEGAAADLEESEKAVEFCLAADCLHRSEVRRLEPGAGLRYSSDDEVASIIAEPGFDLAWPQTSQRGEVARVALAIAVVAQRSTAQAEGSKGADACIQITFVRFQVRDTEESERVPRFKAVTLQQVALGDSFAHRILGVFGFEEETARESECMICYERQRSVILLPCRHCSACMTCLLAMREEKCPLCRDPFSAYLLLPLLRAPAEAADSGRVS